MYEIFTYIYQKSRPDIGKYAIQLIWDREPTKFGRLYVRRKLLLVDVKRNRWFQKCYNILWT